MTLTAALLFCAACNHPVQQPPLPPAEPQTRATVVTIRTSIQPEGRSFTQSLVIAGGLARDTADLDRWRLIDVRSGTVTFVDDVARTYRIEPLAAITRRHTAALAKPLPPGIPRVRWEATPGTKMLLGVPASHFILSVGAYQRELWIGSHPAIPSGLYSMLLASEVPSSRLSPMMRGADAELLKLRGFPLAEHAELPYLDRKLVVDRLVTKIETKNVPSALLQVPAGYHASPTAGNAGSSSLNTKSSVSVASPGGARLP